jgi:hypothetical protein
MHEELVEDNRYFLEEWKVFPRENQNLVSS